MRSLKSMTLLKASALNPLWNSLQKNQPNLLMQPISTSDAVLSLREEVNDVLLCVSVLESALGSLRSDNIMSNKLMRWKQRLNEIHGGGAVMQSVGGTNDDT